MAIFWKSKIFLVGIEASYGVDPALTGAANALLATQVRLQPMEGQDISRELELPYLAAQATMKGGLYIRMSFRVELAGSGSAGTPPPNAPVLRALGVSQTIVPATSTTYRPVTEGPESIHIHFWVGPTRYVIKGARADGELQLNAQGIPYLQVTVTGLFTVPADAVRPTPNLSAFKAPRIVSHANTPLFTIDGQAFVMRNFSMALGNDVQTRFLVGDESIRIVDRAETITTQVEGKPMAVFNPFAAALDEEELLEVKIQHGTVAGRIVTLTAPACQLQRPSELANAQNILEWPLRFVPLPTSGNDQWALVFT